MMIYLIYSEFSQTGTNGNKKKESLTEYFLFIKSSCERHIFMIQNTKCVNTCIYILRLPYSVRVNTKNEMRCHIQFMKFI